MELRQLEHFVAVAEDQSFTRAARRLGYVQSALSVSVQALERELAVRLLDRTTHRVSLTGAGAALLPAARATLAGAHALRDEAAALNGVVRGTLRIGIMQGFSAVDVPAALGRFHREHPLVEITVEPSVGGAGALQARVAAGELDVAFVAIGEVPGRTVRAGAGVGAAAAGLRARLCAAAGRRQPQERSARAVARGVVRRVPARLGGQARDRSRLPRARDRAARGDRGRRCRHLPEPRTRGTRDRAATAVADRPPQRRR